MAFYFGTAESLVRRADGEARFGAILRADSRRRRGVRFVRSSDDALIFDDLSVLLLQLSSFGRT